MVKLVFYFRQGNGIFIITLKQCKILKYILLKKGWEKNEKIIADITESGRFIVSFFLNSDSIV